MTYLFSCDGSAGGVGDGACAADAAAGAAHAFQQVAVVLAGLGQHQQLLALGEALCGCDLDVHIGVPLLDLIGDSLGDAAGLCEAAACAGSVHQIDLIGIDFADWPASISLASMMPASSSKVSTKSTSERTVRREASSFLAAQGPMKHIRASGSACFIMRAVKTMGVMVMEMFLARSGKAVFAIMLHAGQQEVAMKFSLLGHLLKEVVCLVHGAQVGTDGNLHHVTEADEPSGRP